MDTHTITLTTAERDALRAAMLLLALYHEDLVSAPDGVEEDVDRLMGRPAARLSVDGLAQLAERLKDAPEKSPRYTTGGLGGLVIDTQAGGGGIPRCEQGRPIADAFGPHYADLIVAALNAYPEA